MTDPNRPEFTTTTTTRKEPGSNEEIQSFCTTNFGVDFPMYDKITVVGANKHPLYAARIQTQPKATSTGAVPFAEDLKKYGISPNAEPELFWNFEKFLVSRSGEVVPVSPPTPSPQTPH